MAFLILLVVSMFLAVAGRDIPSVAIGSCLLSFYAFSRLMALLGSK